MSVPKEPTATDMLHYIRAAVRNIRQQAAADYGVSEMAAERRCLAEMLRSAIKAESAFEIAVVLGSAAELRVFPEERVLEQCTDAVQAAGHVALRGVVWAVRHRSVKAGNDVQRFAINSCEVNPVRTKSNRAL